MLRTYKKTLTVAFTVIALTTASLAATSDAFAGGGGKGGGGGGKGGGWGHHHHGFGGFYVGGGVGSGAVVHDLSVDVPAGNALSFDGIGAALCRAYASLVSAR